MADWRRADNSRSVSALGRGRGDRCWLVTRAEGCSAKGKGYQRGVGGWKPGGRVAAAMVNGGVPYDRRESGRG